MPFFKSTYNILKKQDEDEAFNPNWMNSDKLILPPQKKWDYSRDLQIEDVDLWEVIYEETAGIGVYASWSPYAEFYMITTGLNFKNAPRQDGLGWYWDRNIETYYGQGALQNVVRRMREMNLPIQLNQYWAEEEDMWLYEKPQAQKLIIV